MPNKGGRKTVAEQVFVERMAATGDRVYSATVAGYAQPARDATRALARPSVAADIAKLQREKLFSEALPAAVTCLVEIITNTKAPAGARVQAAKVVMDRTLGADDSKDDKEPHEMTAEEIAARIAKLEEVAALRAKVVEAVPEPEPIDDVFA